MPTLVSLTRPSLQILGKIQTGVSYFQISGQSLLETKIVPTPEPVMEGFI